MIAVQSPDKSLSTVTCIHLQAMVNLKMQMRKSQLEGRETNTIKCLILNFIVKQLPKLTKSYLKLK